MPPPKASMSTPPKKPKRSACRSRWPAAATTIARMANFGLTQPNFSSGVSAASRSAPTATRSAARTTETCPLPSDDHPDFLEVGRPHRGLDDYLLVLVYVQRR
jgi:hypothetical protein